MKVSTLLIGLVGVLVAVSLPLSTGGEPAHAKKDDVRKVYANSDPGTDADLIENALTGCRGCTVELYGHFLVNKSIKVSDFSGHIKGQGKDVTIVEAVYDEAKDHPFEPVEVDLVNDQELGILLWLDAPAGNITIEGLTLQVSHPSPMEPHPNPFVGVNDSTALNNLLVILRRSTKGYCNCGKQEFVIKDVAMRGARSTADGNYNDKNLVYCGIVGPFWTGPVETTVEDSDFAHCGETAYESWSYVEGSSMFRHNTVSHSTTGVWLSANEEDVTTTITHNAFADVKNPICYADDPPFVGVGEVIVEHNKGDHQVDDDNCLLN